MSNPNNPINNVQLNEYTRVIISEAIKTEDLNLIKSLLQEKNIFSNRNDHSCWLLHQAIDYRNTEIVSTFLEHGVCVESCPSMENSISAIHKAVMNGCKPIIEKLLLHKANWKKPNKNGDTVLHLAFNNNCLHNSQVIIDTRAEMKAGSEKIIIEILELFLDLGMDVNAKNKRKQTPLFLAASNRMISVAKYLADRGAIVSSDEFFIHSLIHDESESFGREKCSSTWNPELLLRIRQENIEFFSWFLSQGFNVDMIDRKGKTVIQSALKYNMSYLLPTLLKYANNMTIDSTSRQTMLHVLLKGYSNKKKMTGEEAIYFALRNQPQDIEEAAKLMISKGVPIDSADETGMTVCSLAAEHRRIGLLKFILDNNRNTEVAESIFPSARKWIVSKDDCCESDLDEVFSILVNKGLFVHSHVEFIMMLFLYAIRHKLEKTIEAICANGVNFNFRTPCGKNLLHLAITQTFLLNKNTQVLEDMLKFIIGHGCNVNETTEDGRTPLHEAICFSNFGAVKILIEHGVDINEKYSDGKRPLHLAIFHYYILQRNNQYNRAKSMEDIINYIVERGCDMNSKTNENRTPLHQAVLSGYIGAIKILIDNGGDINAKEKDGKTPLHLAVSGFGHHDTKVSKNIMKYLIEAGCDINSKANDGKTPLYEAVLLNNIGALKILIERGADTEATEVKFHETALHLAVKKNFEIIVKFLVGNAANVNAKQIDGKTPLHLAIDKENDDIITFFIEKGCNVNIKSKKGTALHIAAKSGRIEIVNLLLENGANIDAQDDQLRTPLHVATKAGRDLIIEVLIKSGADINARKKDGQTPLHMAIFYRKNYIAKTLLRLGANGDAEDDQGIVPLQLALKQSNNEVLECLLQYAVETTNLETMELPSKYCVVWETIFQHFYKLKIIGFPCPEAFRLHVNCYNEGINSQYFWELQKLKNFIIEGSVSMYDFLHMGLKKRFVYTKHEKFNDLMSWVTREFSVYHSIIIASYREAVERKALRELAKTAWLELTGIYLPDLCLDLIIDYSSNKTLKVMIDGSKRSKSLKRPAESRTGNVAKKIDRKIQPIEIICLD